MYFKRQRAVWIEKDIKSSYEYYCATMNRPGRKSFFTLPFTFGKSARADLSTLRMYRTHITHSARKSKFSTRALPWVYRIWIGRGSLTARDAALAPREVDAQPGGKSPSPYLVTRRTFGRLDCVASRLSAVDHECLYLFIFSLVNISPSPLFLAPSHPLYPSSRLLVHIGRSDLPFPFFF